MQIARGQVEQLQPGKVERESANNTTQVVQCYMRKKLMERKHLLTCLEKFIFRIPVFEEKHKRDVKTFPLMGEVEKMLDKARAAGIDPMHE